MTGLVQGFGRIDVDLANSGVFAPGRATRAGDPTGVLAIDGLYSQLVPGTLQLQIGGPIIDLGLGIAEYDRLAVNGDAQLEFGTSFAIRHLSSFDPVLDSFFDVLTSDVLKNILGNPLQASDIDQFAFRGLGLPGQLAFVPSFVDTNADALLDTLRLTVATAPEPSSPLLFGIGLGGAFWASTRRRRRAAVRGALAGAGKLIMRGVGSASS
jgi:hypothetical protein